MTEFLPIAKNSTEIADLPIKVGQLIFTKDTANIFLDISNTQRIKLAENHDAWAPNTYYALNDIVLYENALYLAKEAHTSGATFDVTKWTGLTGSKGDKGDPGLSSTITFEVLTDGIKIISDGPGTAHDEQIIKNGSNGTNGKSAYQIAVEEGYKGTQAEWLESLKPKVDVEKRENGDVIITVDKTSTTVEHYELPTASDTVKGGIKVGKNLYMEGDTLNATNTGGGDLPIASPTQLGGIKVGDNLIIAEDGTLSAKGGISDIPIATEETLGGIIVGENLTIDENGKLSATAVPDPYELPIASETELGGIKVGKNLTINAEGVLDAKGGSGTAAGSQITFGDTKTLFADEWDEENKTQFIQIELDPEARNVVDIEDGEVALWGQYGISADEVENGIEFTYTFLPQEDLHFKITTMYEGGTNVVVLMSDELVLRADSWVDNQQTLPYEHDTKNVTTPIVNPECLLVYGTAGIYATSETENDVTFTCTTVPTDDIKLRLRTEILGNGEGGGGGIKEIPIASETILGGIKVGNNLSITEDGVLSAEAEPYELPAATDTELGGIIVGENLTIDEDGVLNADAAPYELPIASRTELGGFKVGKNLTITSDGTLNATGEGGAGEDEIIHITQTEFDAMREAGTLRPDKYYSVASEDDESFNIIYLSQEEYDRRKELGQLLPDVYYMTPKSIELGKGLIINDETDEIQIRLGVGLYFNEEGALCSSGAGAQVYTQAEWNALPVKPAPGTQVIISDDTSGGSSGDITYQVTELVKVTSPKTNYILKDNISKYQFIMVVPHLGESIDDSAAVDPNILLTSLFVEKRGIACSYNNGTSRSVWINYISDTEIKTDTFTGLTEARLYGLNFYGGGGSGFSKDIYSTDEVKTNKVWIDGKPIYRKVIIVEKTSGVNGTTILENVDSLVNIRGEIYYPSENNWFGFPWASAVTEANIIKSESTKKLNIYTNGGNFTKLRCTVEYTKTTD